MDSIRREGALKLALEDYLVPIKSKINICFDCKKSCGDCPWSAVDEDTRRPKFEPVPGWTATPHRLKIGNCRYGAVYVDTYHITDCPLFELDERLVVEDG